MGGVREAGEEKAGSGRSKRAGSGREMRNANFFNSTMRYNSLKNKNPKIYLTCISRLLSHF